MEKITILWADDEITDIYDIEYESAEIIDETIRDDFKFWIYHNGDLKRLKTYFHLIPIVRNSKSTER